MKKYVAAFLIPFVTACQAESATVPFPKFETTFNTLSSAKVFKTSFPKIMEELRGACKPKVKAPNDFTFGNVECVAETGIKKLKIVPTGDPTVTQVRVIFATNDKCDAAKKILVKQYGKPIVDKKGCFGEWKLKTTKGSPAQTASLEPGDADEAVFDLEEEQGP